MQPWKLSILAASVGLFVLAAAASEAQDRKQRRKGNKPAATRNDKQRQQPTASALPPTGLAQEIDRHLNARLTEEKVPASPRCDDAEFLRRAYLDIHGVIPAPDKVLAFLADQNPDKRAKLIDDLLAQPRYGEHQADIWTRLIIPKDSNNRFLKPVQLRDWLAKKFNDNTPWNTFVTELLTATGNTEENGAAVYFMANNSVDKMTDLTSRLFMGTQLQCAQCHDHPFVPEWKQQDYWGMTAFFLKVRTSNPRGARNGAELTVDETPVMRPNKRNLPEAAKIVPPKFFLGEKASVPDREPLRPVLAKWLTDAENPYFAPAIVNRTWAHFFGRGIVNPIDDFQEKNQPSHPELLQDLNQQFIASGYNLKQLIKAICLSDAYQRTSRPVEGNKDDVTFFSHMGIKNLTPSQLYDCLEQVLGNDDTDDVRRRRRQQQVQRGGPRNPREAFIAFFQTDDGTDPLEYQAGIPQALRLMNAQVRNSATVINRVARPGDKPEVVIERLYLMTLSRKPTAEEMNKLLAIATTHKGEIKKVYEDILWALLNSSEFAMNH